MRIHPTWCTMLMALVAAALPGSARAADFYAYQTRIDSGEPFERLARVGDQADIIIKVAEGKLVFWRGTSYLPYWETSQGRWPLDEIVPRHGDGEGARPDRVNAYSRILLVEDTPQRVTVCWRYLPRFEAGNPRRGVLPTAFVEECFAITPDGQVTRTIRQGTEKIDEWNDPLNQTVQSLQLEPRGIRELSRTNPRRSPAPPPVKGSPLKGAAVVAPVREWRFDETGDSAKEAVTGESSPIPGHKSLWRTGVSGACLQFDGYNTAIALPAAKAPALSSAITLEAWIAIGAYPWNWCPIVQQGDDDGYFLGLSSHAQPGFKLKIGTKWQELVATDVLPRFRWLHLVGTYDSAAGEMALYLDGRKIASRPVDKAPIKTTADPVQVGRGKPRPATDPVGGVGADATYCFDGLIDEVRIYDKALTAEQVAASRQAFLPAEEIAKSPDMDPRALPRFDTAGRFGGFYTHLKYYEAWDNLWCFGPYPDVVVGFDDLPAKFIFWRGTGYIPMLVNEKEQWYSNEFNETWNRSGGQGCQEPMSDKQSLFNHARILENTPARVVVQWRFPLIDVHQTNANFNPQSGWGDWSDWYYYIYPDGVAVKRMHLWTDGPRNHEWQESMAILGPNQHPEQVLETEPALTLADLQGNATGYNWTKGPPRNVNYRDQKIHIVNYKADYDPFTIGDFTAGNVYGGGAVPYSVFPSWNHWPVAQIPSDGRYAIFPDRAAHCSLTHVYMPDFRAQFGDRPFQEKLLMEGLSKQSAKDLAPLARSWLRAPKLEMLTDCAGPGYDPSQRAYVLCATGGAPHIRIDASDQRPLVNPCFVVRNWNCGDKATVLINSDVQPDGPGVRQGIVRDPNGRQELIVWLRRQITDTTTFTIRGAKPAPATKMDVAWEAAPQKAPTDPFAVNMAARRVDGVGVEYRFECSAGSGHSSEWQEDPLYTDSSLAPDSEVSYRVKSRDRYFAETPWSPEVRVKIGPQPAPTAWKLDEGEGQTAKDSSGQHELAARGAVEWAEGVAGKALRLDGKSYLQLDRAADLRSSGSFTWMAWIRTTKGGPILARTDLGREWRTGGKVMFVENGRLRFDVGWVGATGADTPIADGQWHHVAVVVSGAREGKNVQCYVDGRPAGGDRLDVAQHDESALGVRIGYCNEDFPPGRSGFMGDLDEVQWFNYALSPESLTKFATRAPARPDAK